MSCAAIIELILSGAVGFFTTLFGAGAGAYAAYLFAMKQQSDNTKSAQYQAATNAMIMLHARIMVLQTFRRNSMSEDRSELVPGRATSVIAQYSPSRTLDFAGLSFLADRDDSQFLHELGLSEANYFNFVEALGERNGYLIDLLARFKGDDRYDADGEPMITLKAHEMKILTEQNRNLVKIAGIALDLTKLNLVRFQELFERRFTGLPVFAPSIPNTDE